ncbi:hypothetical protein B0H12DRAFT_1218889 [Mycena haematopus]|nr:hypothetical protein B0H12DRAFT_1218889 [Mycena haematopus]
MPPSNATEILVDNIVASVKVVVPLLDELHDGLGPPFIQAISNTALSVIRALQNVKRNKEECCQLTENIHGIIYAIVNIHMKSEPPGTLPPATLEHVGKFTETLHKIHTFVEAQQDGNKIIHFFRQNQMSALLKDCWAGLQLALDSFVITSGATLLHNIDEMRRKTRDTHDELLELISTLSDVTVSDRASSMYQTLNKSQTSSQSLSLLPAMPQIFHGRERELTQIVQMLNQQCAKIAILGPGGIGKTNLARAALHHPTVAAKYEDRIFVSCESATTSLEIAGFIGAHLGLKPAKNLTKSVLRSLAKKSICLLILDNLETTWEPLESRGSTEDLISSLTDIPHLALIVTMRGAEHPAKVRWTRPFLPPLVPLSLEAARQTFNDIADTYHGQQDIDLLLQFTDNMPLAVNLIAHLVAYEGCASTLARLETEKTSLLSEGSDRQSNLDTSIALSLSSPRLTAQTGAIVFLQLLSILPDGLSDVELVQSKLVIPQILACKSVLLGTSLAYLDSKKRLKLLVPIREYLQHFHPVAPSTILPLQRHFQKLLDMYRVYSGSNQVANIVMDITLNLGNIHQVLYRGLTQQNPDLPEAIRCTLSLNAFGRLTGRGLHVLMHSIQAVIPSGDYKLEVEFTIEVLHSNNYGIIKDRELLASEARSHCRILNDPDLEGRLYCALGLYYCWYTDNRVDEGMQCFERAMKLARDTGDMKAQYLILINPALIKWRKGEYNTSQVLANEAHELAQLCGNLYQQANALRVKAMCAQSLGNLKDCLYQLQTARELLGLCGMSRGALDFQLRMTVATTHMEKSEYAKARGLFTQIASEMSVEQEQGDLGIIMINIGQIDVITGASKQDVLRSLEMAKTIFNSVEHFAGTTYYKIMLAYLELREGDVLAAKSHFEECLHWSWTGHTQVSSFCLEKMADIGRWGPENFDWASTSGIVHLAFSQKMKQKLGLYKALCSMGDMFLSNGDDLTAENLFAVALEGFTKMDVHQSRADCMLRLGDIAAHRGNNSEAEMQWRNARPLFELSSQVQDITKIDAKLERLTSTSVAAEMNIEVLRLKNVGASSPSTQVLWYYNDAHDTTDVSEESIQRYKDVIDRSEELLFPAEAEDDEHFDTCLYPASYGVEAPMHPMRPARMHMYLRRCACLLQIEEGVMYYTCRYQWLEDQDAPREMCCGFDSVGDEEWRKDPSTPKLESVASDMTQSRRSSHRESSVGYDGKNDRKLRQQKRKESVNSYASDTD